MMKKNIPPLLIAFLVAAAIIGYSGKLFFESRKRLEAPGEVRPEVKEVSTQPSIEKAQDTTAPIKYPNLRLEGTVISEVSSAFIRDLDSQNAGHFNVGDTVSGAKLIDIERGMVTLDLDGKKFILYLEKPYMDGPIVEVSDSLRIVNRDKLLELLNLKEESLKTDLDIRPYVDSEGNFCGYEISGLKVGSLPYWGGLRNGDIIKAVNEQKLTTQQKAIQTFKKVRKLKEVELSIARDKKDINLTYKVDKK